MNTEIKKYEMPQPIKIASLVLALLGAIVFIVALKIDSQRAWANFLSNYFYWASLGMAGIFFTALQHITGSCWSVTIRRVAESFIGFLPVALGLLVILIFGMGSLFEWVHHDALAHDALLKMKSVYLNKPFFIVRAVLLYALCFFVGGKMICNSNRQDESGDIKFTQQNVKLSAVFLFLFAWLYTFHSIDLIMSLSPHWFSTIFGIYCWSGLFYSGLAMISIWVIRIKKRGLYGDFVNGSHLHDLASLMFAFLVFWAYIAFSQFMLIWYANLPEETFFFVNRLQGGWKSVSQGLLLFKFAVPFLLLIGRWQKRIENWHLFMGFWFLATQALDVYWLVFPTFYKEPDFGWIEVGMFFGFAGLFVFSVGRKLSRWNLVPLKDPRLEQCLHHHQ